ncbi:hypothetical protein CC78DRAFT_568594 [Lojkania enalia]|uniref:Uncharacterized protein n=1 Tax=Lojkania enalia TaxID=147567 RepID=A0A9P4KA74_9PLEO|nr:hypothetical protein CC78DRAFT_568594 [Didymosphaeria enalia]
MPKSEVGKIVGLGAAAGAIGGAYKTGEFLYRAKRLRDVGPANAVYVRLINRVRADLDEVKRLLTVPEVKDALEANRPKARWVYGAMRDVRGALENITPLTERVAGDIEDGRRVGLRHRLRWLLSEKEKLENREKELNVAHASLTEVIGYLTALEPVEETDRGAAKDTRIDIEIGREPDRYDERRVYIDERERPERRVEERDIYIEHERHRPRRVEEREVWVERDGRPRHGEGREVFVERHHGPRHVEEYDRWEQRGTEPRHVYEERYYDERQPGEQRELHLERDPRHVEARYSERGQGYYDDKRYEERYETTRRPRRLEEERVPERETFMQSDSQRSQYGPYGEYAEYGAPQPSGAAQYRRRYEGDPGFGDDLITDPQPVPPVNRYAREEWVEEREDYRLDQYGNRLPEPLQRTRYPRTRL